MCKVVTEGGKTLETNLVKTWKIACSRFAVKALLQVVKMMQTDTHTVRALPSVEFFFVWSELGSDPL